MNTHQHFTEQKARDPNSFQLNQLARPAAELDFESGGNCQPDGKEVRLCKTSFMEADNFVLWWLSSKRSGNFYLFFSMVPFSCPTLVTWTLNCFWKLIIQTWGRSWYLWSKVFVGWCHEKNEYGSETLGLCKSRPAFLLLVDGSNLF